MYWFITLVINFYIKDIFKMTDLCKTHKMMKYGVFLMQASLFEMLELLAPVIGSLSPHHWNK